VRDTIHGAIVSPERRFVRVDELAVRLQHAWGAFHMDRAGLELEIGFGRLRASRGVLFAFSGKLRDLWGRSATR
jgi:hypothetical protein